MDSGVLSTERFVIQNTDILHLLLRQMAIGLPRTYLKNLCCPILIFVEANTADTLIHVHVHVHGLTIFIA